MAEDIRSGDNSLAEDENVEESPRETSTSQKKTSSGRKRKSRSKYDQLDEKWNNKFSTLDSKLDSMFEFMKKETAKQKGTENGDKTSVSAERSSHRRTESHSPRHSSEESDIDLPMEDDNISLQPGQTEVLGSGSESEDAKSDSETRSSKTKKCLFELFGDDAVTKKTEKKVGIELDDSQKQVLLGHWRADKPNTITAFAEENKDMFPVGEETEKYLQVPSIDDMIGRCLIKKHGSKASFAKGKTLFSQPYKMLERIAYKGQQASYLGIIISMYMQQGLGNLIEILTQDKPNVEKAIQQTKDIFAMSTKGLDQIGRAGAFHHILRRQMCMTDTSLFLMDDSRDITDLPLSGEGLFGEQLVTTLKSRKEKDKTLDDLLPEVFPKNDRKRKSGSSGEGPKAKKNNQEKVVNVGQPVSKDSNNSFRIPKISGYSYTKKRFPTAEGSKQSKSDITFKGSSGTARGGKPRRQ